MDDPNIFNCITDPADEEVAAQSAAYSKPAAGAAFVVETVETHVPQLAMIEVSAELQLFAEKPWLDERDLVVLHTSANLSTQTKLLPAAHKFRRIEQVEISLRYL